MEPWSADHVVGLAPDGAAVSAARKLATPASWPAFGCAEGALWGLAQGSGQSPYQVAVDLSGPAYKCSCPSRKIPCKHVLGLLLVWAARGGAVGSARRWGAIRPHEIGGRRRARRQSPTDAATSSAGWRISFVRVSGRHASGP